MAAYVYGLLPIICGSMHLDGVACQCGHFCRAQVLQDQVLDDNRHIEEGAQEETRD